MDLLATQSRSDGTPTVLGINRTQDASLALMYGWEPLCAIQKERITGQRHHWGKLGDMALYQQVLPRSERPELIVECYSSDPEGARLEEYQQETAAAFGGRAPRTERISHHLAHLYSCFHTSPFEQAAVMVIDCQGSPAREIQERWPGKERSGEEWLEVASYYACRGRDVECVGKQLWDGDPVEPVGLGFFYHLLTQCLFPGQGHEGKVMGLAPYGDPEALNLPDLVVEDHNVYISDKWFEVFYQPARFGFFRDRSGSFQHCADLAAAGQRAFEDALLKVAAWSRRVTGLQALCYAGGCALNCVANDRLARESPFAEVFIPPAPHDGGTALGCAVYGLTERIGLPGRMQWQCDYLGPPHDASGFAQTAEGHSELEVLQPSSIEKYVAELLAQGHVVSLYHGRSEFGPRALGNRSILADPRYAVMRTYINERVKGREWFRPLAPVVRDEQAAGYFDNIWPSPFMQFAAPVKPAQAARIPAAVHVDGTARLQTVDSATNAFLAGVLDQFQRCTGCAVLLNTSFNGKGETIVETPADALRCFRAMPINALVVPPWVILRREFPCHPLRT